MNGNPWHKRYHSDALNGYMALSLEERGAYTTLLDMLYDRGEPILDNDRLIAGYMGVSVRKARAMVESLIGKGKIIRTGGGHLTNARFEKERENELKTSRKHAENGSEGGRKSAELSKKAKENNEGIQARLEPASSLIRSQKLEVEGSVEAKASPGADAPLAESGPQPEPAPDPVKVMFDAGVRLLGANGSPPAKARALIGKWRKDHGAEAVIEALGRAQREGAIDPVSFIEGCFRFKSAKAKPQYGDTRTVSDGRRQVWLGEHSGWQFEVA